MLGHDGVVQDGSGRLRFRLLGEVSDRRCCPGEGFEAGLGSLGLEKGLASGLVGFVVG